MANNELNLGSTFKDFLNALNTNTEDTKGIIQGTKKVKKLSFGEENETQDFNSILTEKNDDDTWSLLLESEHDIELNVGDQSGISIVDRDIQIFVPEEDASIISIVGGDIDIQGRWSDGSAGSVFIKGGNSSSLNIGSSGGKDIAYLSANDEIRIKATNDKENGELIISGDYIRINGDVDFSNANVIGLPNNGGASDCDANAIIDVTALPTENINENVIYRLNIATYLFGASAGYQPFPMAKCNVVETLPSSGNPAATFDTSLNVTAIETYYEQSTNRNMGYVDEKLSGIGNMPVGWYTAEQLFALINRTYFGVIFSTSEMVDMGIYLLIEYNLYTYKNGIFKSLEIDVNKNYQWNGDNAFNGNNTFNGSVRLYGYTNFIGDASDPSGSLAIYTNGFGIHSTETTFTKKVLFNGEVDFSNATITGLSSGGGESNIPEEVISYDSEINLLSLTSNSLALISKNLEFAANTLEDSSISFIVGLNDETGMYASSGILNFFANEGEINFISRDSINFTTGEDSNITFNANIVDFASAEVKVNSLTIGSRESYFQAYETNLTIFDDTSLYLWVEDENGDNSEISIYGNHITYNSETHTFYGKVDFTNATVTGLPTNGGGSLDLNADYNWNGNHTFNNGITLNGALTLANNGEIEDTEDSLTIYKGTGSMWIGTEEGGYIDINNDEMLLESYAPLRFLSNQDLIFAAIGSINIYSGENDDTYFYISPTGMDVTANNGDINFTTENKGSISFFAIKEGNESSIIVYDTTIEYNSQNHQFKGNVNFGLANENARFEINVGADDDTTVYFTPTELLFSSVGVVNFTGNQGITFTAGQNSSTKFNGAVDFSNANVTGLPSGGLTQEQVQEMINTAINGALEGNY